MGFIWLKASYICCSKRIFSGDGAIIKIIVTHSIKLYRWIPFANKWLLFNFSLCVFTNWWNIMFLIIFEGQLGIRKRHVANGLMCSNIFRLAAAGYCVCHLDSWLTLVGFVWSVAGYQFSERISVAEIKGSTASWAFNYVTRMLWLVPYREIM